MILQYKSQTQLISPRWPIRNCSLMLFKSLIERLLGSDEAQDWKESDRAKTSRFSYDNFPSLVDILSNLLNPEGPLKDSLEGAPDSSSPFDLHGAEGVFPALQILRQAQPPESHLVSLRLSVERLLASPHWHMRDMAARTMTSLYPTHHLYEAVCALLRIKDRSHNTQHGKLLTVRYMLKKLFAEIDYLGELLNNPLLRQPFLAVPHLVVECELTRHRIARALEPIKNASRGWETVVRSQRMSLHQVCFP